MCTTVARSHRRGVAVWHAVAWCCSVRQVLHAPSLMIGCMQVAKQLTRVEASKQILAAGQEDPSPQPRTTNTGAVSVVQSLAHGDASGLPH